MPMYSLYGSVNTPEESNGKVADSHRHHLSPLPLSSSSLSPSLSLSLSLSSSCVPIAFAFAFVVACSSTRRSSTTPYAIRWINAISALLVIGQLTLVCRAQEVQAQEVQAVDAAESPAYE